MSRIGKAAAVAACVASALLCAGAARAQCAFDHSPKAKGVKLSMVRAMESCPGPGHPVPNATTSDGLQACAPPISLSSYSFASTGSKCDVRVLHKAASQCGVNASCSAVTLSAKCSGILDENDSLIDGETSWRLQLSMRITGDDVDNGDMTIIDVPVEIAFPDARGGKLALKVARNTLDVLGQFEIPACSSMALVDDVDTLENSDFIVAKILDPDGNTFATAGTAGPASAPNCGIDVPGRTKSIKGSLVRAFEGCPTPSFPAPNSSTGDGAPACAPPFALSANRYDERSGGCRLTMTQKLGECSPPCAPLRFDLKCKGVMLANGITPIDETGWKLRLIARVTTTDPGAGDVTVVDLPADIALPAFDRGHLNARSIATELNAAIPPPNSQFMHACTSVEIIDVKLLDASGDEFARLGTAAFPR